MSTVVHPSLQIWNIELCLRTYSSLINLIIATRLTIVIAFRPPFTYGTAIPYDIYRIWGQLNLVEKIAVRAYHSTKIKIILSSELTGT